MCVCPVVPVVVVVVAVFGVLIARKTMKLDEQEVGEGIGEAGEGERTGL